VVLTRGGAVAARRAHNPKVVGSNPTPATKNDSSLNNLPLRELLIMLLDECAQRKLRLSNLQNTELFKLWDNEMILRYRTPNTLHESRRFFGHFYKYLGEFPPSVELGKSFLTSFADCKPATLYRYSALLKQFFNWLGYSWTVKIRMPKQLPEYIDDKDVDALEEAIKTKHNFKKTIARDLLLVDVDKDTGLRRTECYKQRHRAFST